MIRPTEWVTAVKPIITELKCHHPFRSSSRAVQKNISVIEIGNETKPHTIPGNIAALHAMMNTVDVSAPEVIDTTRLARTEATSAHPAEIMNAELVSDREESLLRTAISAG